MKSMSGVSRTRAESDRHGTGVDPTERFTYATVAACARATAATTGATGVLCLAFPVHPPGRPEKDRLAELAAPTVSVLVVQGERDPFGLPPPAPGRSAPPPESLRAG